MVSGGIATKNPYQWSAIAKVVAIIPSTTTMLRERKRKNPVARANSRYKSTLKIATARIVHAAPSRTGPSSSGVITAQETTRFTSSSCNLSLVRPRACSNQMMTDAIKSAARTAIVIQSVTGESNTCRNPKSLARVIGSISTMPQRCADSLQSAENGDDATGDDKPEREHWDLPISRARDNGAGNRGNGHGGHSLLFRHRPAKLLVRAGDFSLRS